MARQRVAIVATPSDQDAQALSAIFGGSMEWERVRARTGAEALDLVEKHEDRLAILLIDVALLDEGGVTAIHRLQSPGTIDCPPVLLLLPDGAALQAVPKDLFLSEYLLTPIRPRIAERRITAILELHSYQRRDITYRHSIARDPLLGLLTGRSLSCAVDKALHESGGSPGLMLYINVDGMRAINERSSYHFGDLVLVDMARTLTRELPSDAVIGRPHNDTFCVFLPFRMDEMENIRMLEALKHSLRRAYPDAPGGPQVVTCCIGAAASPRNGDTYQLLHEAAETANSAAKQMGRDILLIYTEALDRRLMHNNMEPFSDGVEKVTLVERFVSVLSSTGTEVAGYEYVSMPADMKPNAYQAALDRLAVMPDRSIIHATRVEIKRFFSRLQEIERQGMAASRYFLYIVLRDDQTEMLPQMLQDALSAHTIHPSQVVVSIHQSMVLEMNRSRLELLAKDIAALGFSFGIYGVGEQYIVNACYLDHLFDRILLAPSFTYDLLDGFYPPEFVERVIGYFVRMKKELCFSAVLSESARASMAEALRGTFTYYGEVLSNVDAVIAHARAHRQRPVQAAEKKEALSFRIGDDRYNEIFSRSGIILFDWRAHNDTIALSQSFDAVYGVPPTELTGESLVDSLLHPEDRPRLRDLLLQVKHGRPNAEGIFRVHRVDDPENRYRWRRFFLISTLHENGVVAHVYCISFDVDRERKAMQNILRRAETDPLTGLYNRGATESHILATLDSDEAEAQHALMIIDLDNFKAINDAYGHMEGDLALQHIAHQMQALVREGDVVGRIGGDEFMVFIKNITSSTLIGQRAEDICVAARAGKPEWGLSCTIGIACYPQDGDTFESLYAKADLALYQTKERGKNGWAFYNKEAD